MQSWQIIQIKVKALSRDGSTIDNKQAIAECVKF